MKHQVKLSIIFLGLIIFSCMERKEEKRANFKVEISEDKTVLAKIINLEIPINACLYDYSIIGDPNSRVPGPNDYKLNTILYYSEENYQKISDSIRISPEIEILNPERYIKNWFPDEVKKILENDSKVRMYEAKYFQKNSMFGRVILIDKEQLAILYMATS